PDFSCRMVHLRDGTRSGMAPRFYPRSLVFRVDVCATDKANYAAVLYLAWLGRAPVCFASGADAPLLGLADSRSEDCTDSGRLAGDGYVDVVLDELAEQHRLCYDVHAWAYCCHMG